MGVAGFQDHWPLMRHYAEVLDARGPYSQARADRIHNRSVEQEIEEAGKKPEEVKAQVNRRLRSLTR